jgi:hypothetical protein
VLDVQRLGIPFGLHLPRCLASPLRRRWGLRSRCSLRVRTEGLYRRDSRFVHRRDNRCVRRRGRNWQCTAARGTCYLAQSLRCCALLATRTEVGCSQPRLDRGAAAGGCRALLACADRRVFRARGCSLAVRANFGLFCWPAPPAVSASFSTRAGDRRPYRDTCRMRICRCLRSRVPTAIDQSLNLEEWTWQNSVPRALHIRP